MVYKIHKFSSYTHEESQLHRSSLVCKLKSYIHCMNLELNCLKVLITLASIQGCEISDKFIIYNRIIYNNCSNVKNCLKFPLFYFLMSAQKTFQFKLFFLKEGPNESMITHSSFPCNEAKGKP